MNFRQPAGVIAGQEAFPRRRGVEPKCTVPTLKKIGWGTLICNAVALAVFGVLVATGVLA